MPFKWYNASILYKHMSKPKKLTEIISIRKVIGMFVSIDMLFQGWNYVMLALVARKGAAVVAPQEH